MKFDITDLIYRVPNFLSNDECDILIDEHKKKYSEYVLESCPDSNTGVDTKSTFKRISLEEETETYNLIFTKTEKAINQYIDYLDSFKCFHIPALRNKAFLYSHMFRLLRYDVGDKIHPHTDHDPFTYGSITFNLNDNYTGGEFKFFNGSYEVKLTRGEMMIWPADYFWVHEVAQIKSGVRYSSNSFLLSIPPEYKLKTYNFIGNLFSQDIKKFQRYKIH
jgi:hypothetical protein